VNSLLNPSVEGGDEENLVKWELRVLLIRWLRGAYCIQTKGKQMLHCERCEDLIFEADLSVVYYIDDEAVCGDCMNKAEARGELLEEE
jgi:hypothetical protein